MKNLHYVIFFVFVTLYSCKRQHEVNPPQLDKLYIVEFNYGISEGYGNSCSSPFWVAGFCELNNEFNLRYARTITRSSNYYNYSESVIPDSIGNKISNVLLRYQTDTTFLYSDEELGNMNYDGNYYLFIMQKHNQKDIIIPFARKLLPEDLKFIYLYLYENREKTEDISRMEHIDRCDSLFEMFFNHVRDRMFRKTIQFTPPIVVEERMPSPNRQFGASGGVVS